MYSLLCDFRCQDWAAGRRLHEETTCRQRPPTHASLGPPAPHRVCQLTCALGVFTDKVGLEKSITKQQ